MHCLMTCLKCRFKIFERIFRKIWKVLLKILRICYVLERLFRNIREIVLKHIRKAVSKYWKRLEYQTNYFGIQKGCSETLKVLSLNIGKVVWNIRKIVLEHWKDVLEYWKDCLKILERSFRNIRKVGLKYQKTFESEVFQTKIIKNNT